MTPSFSSSIRLFRFSGIQVYLHWSWFLVAFYEFSARRGQYVSPLWNIAEYVALFAIVTLHEFGHALACRQTGGQAHDIVLWPLGGIAFVAPPPRPGAVLWSIAAGPLVNVVLVPVLFGVTVVSVLAGWSQQFPDLARFERAVFNLNAGLLIFNLLPVYPLDGGQIVRSLLWFGFGRARSLRIAAILGMLGVAAGVIWLASLSFGERSFGIGSLFWPALLALFLGQRCWLGLREARYLEALERAPRHTGFTCPTCGHAPPGGPMWLCQQCHGRFDPFSTDAVCPHCHGAQVAIPCAHCGAAHPIGAWRREPPVL